MTTFDDGPAKGQNLELERTPFFLRVTERSGKWDGLDQMSDKPFPEEKLFAYKLAFPPTRAFVRRDKRAGGSGLIVYARYALVTPQPTDEEMRGVIPWRKWCEDHRAEFEAFKSCKS